MNSNKKVSLYTLGCKLNFSETSSLSRIFQEEGYASVEFEDTPDVYVLNTCSVTENADKKCKQLVNRALKINPDAFVIIVGCYAQLKPSDISNIPGVDMVLGAKEKFNIMDHLVNLQKKKDTVVISSGIKEVNDFVPSYSKGGRTRSFLKVQDGCDYFCSFCTIPLARGKSRNDSIEKTLEVAGQVANSPAKEVVLTGVNIGDFGQGGEENLYQLIQKLDNVEGIDRYRISSIEPNLLEDDIIGFVANSKKFMPHFHIPLQSGSDRILKLMRRKYERELYIDKINKIKDMMPHACIGVDVIVGFPDEGEEDFSKTYELLVDLDVSYLHVFTYSERQNTTAYKMNNSVDPIKRNERSKMLRILSQKKRRAFYTQHLGETFNVLFESENKDGFLHGFTENYIKVKVDYKKPLENTIQKVTLHSIDYEEMLAKIKEPVFN